MTISVSINVTSPGWSVSRNGREGGTSATGALGLLDKEYRAARAFLLAMGAQDTSPNTADRPTGDAPQPERRTVTGMYPERRRVARGGPFYTP